MEARMPANPLEDLLFPSTAELFGRIRRGQGIDLEAYRPETLRPLLRRRMDVLGVDSLATYLALTARDPGELKRLLDLLLIGSTAFFRDAPSFDALRDYFTSEGEPWPEGPPLRAWVAGCSTGEEAYSLAMLLLEQAEACEVRVFATDLRSTSLQKARQGFYRESAMGGVSPERRARFFVPAHGGYQVTRRLRNAVVFGQHDLLVDPPFSRLDVISCRNVLLYLGEAAQLRVLERFHFGLQPEGVLFLGPAESTAAAPRHFRPHDRAHRLYRKLPAKLRGEP